MAVVYFDLSVLIVHAQARKDELQQQGFNDWNKRDFTQFIKACEKWGREDLDHIVTEMENKAPEAVRKYAEVFWKRYTEIPGYEALIRKRARVYVAVCVCVCVCVCFDICALSPDCLQSKSRRVSRRSSAAWRFRRPWT
jgi:hypothetical protein